MVNEPPIYEGNYLMNELPFRKGMEKLMREPNMKKINATTTITALALATLMIYGLLGRYSANAKSELNLSHTTIAPAASLAAQTTGVVLPKANIYTLNSDNVIFVLTPGATSFTRLGRVNRIDGNLIGIDFRPADGAASPLYGVTDTGKVYAIAVSSTQLGAATLVSTLSPRFAGGFQSLMDFNPVVNAIRLIGTNDQNHAIVNSGGNLNVTAVQTALTYAPGDVNAGADPNICGGTYTNSYANAPNTLFYAIDHDLDTFVTISSVSSTGSSNTGGGLLQTIGPIVDASGNPINCSPTADLDAYTDASGLNSIIGVSGRTIFTIDLGQINTSLALGSTQKVVAKTLSMAEPGGGYIDIAVASAGETPTPTTPPAPTPTPTPAPTPTPTPAPTPAPAPTATTYQAEKGTLGGGAWIMTNHTGFTGTGFVDFADNVANSYVQFSINETGSRTLTFRYANGSTVNRTCNVTLNGASIGMLSFPPTGNWDTWKTTSLTVNLGASSGGKALRVTAATNKGGPNIDKLTVK